VATARRKGLAVDDQIAKRQVTTIGNYVESWRERALPGVIRRRIGCQVPWGSEPRMPMLAARLGRWNLARSRA